MTTETDTAPTTERSMPPCMITSVWPRATMPSTAAKGSMPSSAPLLTLLEANTALTTNSRTVAAVMVISPRDTRSLALSFSRVIVPPNDGCDRRPVGIEARAAIECNRPRSRRRRHVDLDVPLAVLRRVERTERRGELERLRHHRRQVDAGGRHEADRLRPRVWRADRPRDRQLLRLDQPQRRRRGVADVDADES